MNCCCYQCEDRKVNCHAWCERYKEWQGKNQERLDAINREKVKDSLTIARQIARKNTMYKRGKEGLKMI